MDKPTWDTAPEWAQWLAKTRKGNWYWFENEPTLTPNKGAWLDSGKIQSAKLPAAQPYLECRPTAKASNSRCCCPPKDYSGLWGAGLCPVHFGLNALARSNT